MSLIFCIALLILSSSKNAHCLHHARFAHPSFSPLAASFPEHAVHIRADTSTALGASARTSSAADGDFRGPIARRDSYIRRNIAFPLEKKKERTNYVVDQNNEAIPSAGVVSETFEYVPTLQLVGEISSIALPALGGMLLDPIMSLVDTACVGQVSTIELASMAPCTSVFQFIFFVFFFLSAATTNLVAANPPEAVVGLNKTDARQRVDFNEQVVSSASAFAVMIGVVVAALLIRFTDPILFLAGCPSSNLAMLEAARPYLRVRALGMPFVFVATVLQGASLGRHDAWTPLKIFGAAGVLNLIGDVLFALYSGWGALGAATATLVSQAAASCYFIGRSVALDKAVSASSRPGRGVALVWKGIPSMDIVRSFSSVAATLFTRSIGAMLSYSLMTRTAATMGTTALASHQVTLQVWWMLSFIPEPMAVVAQTLITRDMKDRSWRVPKLIRVLYGTAISLGGIAGIFTFISLTVPQISSALVADASVRTLTLNLVPAAVLSQFYCPLASLSDGACIGLGAFSHLPAIMIGSAIATAVGLLLVEKSSLGVGGVWACMNIFLTSRVLGHLLLSKKLREFIGKRVPMRA